MSTTVPQSSGHTIHASHIEEPKSEFFVAFHSPSYSNILHFEEGQRWVRVLAETPEGAVEVTRYHYRKGSNFELLPEDPTSRERGVSSSPENRKGPSMEPKDALNADLITALREVASIEASDPDGIRHTWKDLAITSARIVREALADYEVKTTILEALSDKRLHPTSDLVGSLSELGEGKVKEALLDLADKEAVSLQRHNWPSNPAFGDVNLMPSDKFGNVYIAASLRDQNSLGDALRPELISSLQKIADVEALGPDRARRSWKEIATSSIDTAKEAIDKAESFSPERTTIGVKMELIYAERIDNDTGGIIDRGIFHSIEEFAPFRADGWSGAEEVNALTDEWLQKQAAPDPEHAREREFTAESPDLDLSFMDRAHEAPDHGRVARSKFESSDPDHSFGF